MKLIIIKIQIPIIIGRKSTGCKIFYYDEQERKLIRDTDIVLTINMADQELFRQG